jgi:hypothetical protein
VHAHVAKTFCKYARDRGDFDASKFDPFASSCPKTAVKKRRVVVRAEPPKAQIQRTNATRLDVRVVQSVNTGTGVSNGIAVETPVVTTASDEPAIVDGATVEPTTKRQRVHTESQTDATTMSDAGVPANPNPNHITARMLRSSYQTTASMRDERNMLANYIRQTVFKGRNAVSVAEMEELSCGTPPLEIRTLLGPARVVLDSECPHELLEELQITNPYKPSYFYALPHEVTDLSNLTSFYDGTTPDLHFAFDRLEHLEKLRHVLQDPRELVGNVPGDVHPFFVGKRVQINKDCSSVESEVNKGDNEYAIVESAPKRQRSEQTSDVECDPFSCGACGAHSFFCDCPTSTTDAGVMARFQLGDIDYVLESYDSDDHRTRLAKISAFMCIMRDNVGESDWTQLESLNALKRAFYRERHGGVFLPVFVPEPLYLTMNENPVYEWDLGSTTTSCGDVQPNFMYRYHFWDIRQSVDYSSRILH